ncbi:MAG: HD domain-containing protein [Dehalococcoidia bacterium]|nr:HD domain-containing protein [Dehalococcoidia bacterium]
MPISELISVFTQGLRLAVPTGVLKHSERVAELAGDLMSMRGEAPETAILMGFAHDICRHFSDEEWLICAEKQGVLVSDLERRYPVLLHGPVGAKILQESFDIDSKEVLQAVRYHTYGHPTFSNSAWAMFVADKIEPQKLERNSRLGAVYELSQDSSRSLPEIALAILNLQIGDLTADGREIHSLQIASRNFLVSEQL